MSFHIDGTFGVTAPSGAVISEARKSGRLENVKPVRNPATGATIHTRQKKVKESDITLTGNGDPGFASVVAGAFTEGTPKIISAEGTEVNDGEYSEMELSAKVYEDTE